MATRPSTNRGNVTIWLLFFFAAPFVGGLGLMWTVKVAHALWWSAIPTIGYWPSVLLFILLRVTVGWTRSYKTGN